MPTQEATCIARNVHFRGGLGWRGLPPARGGPRVSPPMRILWINEHAAPIGGAERYVREAAAGRPGGRY